MAAAYIAGQVLGRGATLRRAPGAELEELVQLRYLWREHELAAHVARLLRALGQAGVRLAYAPEDESVSLAAPAEVLELLSSQVEGWPRCALRRAVLHPGTASLPAPARAECGIDLCRGLFDSSCATVEACRPSDGEPEARLAHASARVLRIAADVLAPFAESGAEKELVYTGRACMEVLHGLYRGFRKSPADAPSRAADVYEELAYGGRPNTCAEPAFHVLRFRRTIPGAPAPWKESVNEAGFHVSLLRHMGDHWYNTGLTVSPPRGMHLEATATPLLAAAGYAMTAARTAPGTEACVCLHRVRPDAPELRLPAAGMVQILPRLTLHLDVEEEV